MPTLGENIILNSFTIQLEMFFNKKIQTKPKTEASIQVL